MNDSPALAFESTIASSRAWWSGSLNFFRVHGTSSIVERLAFRTIETHRINYEQQLRAWQEQIDILRPALANLPDEWRLLLEYPLLRLGRRLDAVLISDRAIFVIEFKIGSTVFDNAAR